MTSVPMVRQRNLLSVEDVAAQEALSDRLTALRREHYGARDFAALLGITHNNLHGFEHRSKANSSVYALERRAAPLGLRLALDVEGLPAEVEDDLSVMILASARPEDIRARARTTALLTAERLQVGRVDLGVTERELARRLGIRPATVGGLFREAGATSRVASFQRIARALEARVTPRLIPLNGESHGNAS